MPSFLKDSHELEESKCSTNLKVLEPAVQTAQDGGVVSADVKHFVELKVQVAVQGLDEQISGSLKDIEGP